MSEDNKTDGIVKTPRKRVDWNTNFSTWITTCTHIDETLQTFNLSKIIPEAILLILEDASIPKAQRGLICTLIEYGFKQKVVDKTARPKGQTLTTGQLKQSYTDTYNRLCTFIWNAPSASRKTAREVYFMTVDRAIQDKKIDEAQAVAMKAGYDLINS